MLATDSRASDITCRYGGDEFLVLLPGAARPTAVNRAESWRRNFSKRNFIFEGDSISLTVSIGVACYPINSASPDGLLKAADKALYASKSKKNQVSVSPRTPTRPLRPLDDKSP
jgi:diguanylate cyclase (GGDEF)-like protein